MESDDFTRHYIIRYLSARELVLPPLHEIDLREIFECAHFKFTVYGRKRAGKQARPQCSPASVGLAQARPINYSKSRENPYQYCKSRENPY